MFQYWKIPVTMKMMYNQMMIDGVFSDLSEYDVPWSDIEDIDESLDYAYYARSANKIVSPFVYDLSGNTGVLVPDDVVSLTEEQRTIIAKMLFNLYHSKWDRLWNLYSIEYNPIYNYNMTESETIDTTKDRTETDTGTLTTVVDGETTDTGTVVDSGTMTQDDGIFGFNSSDSVGSDTRDIVNGNTRTNNLASTDDTTRTETHNLTNDIDSTDNVERELTKQGNIGVTTTQRMIESELEVWQWNYFMTVFNDIDEFLTLDLY